MSIEHSRRRRPSSEEVLIRGIAEKTTLDKGTIRALINVGKLETTVFNSVTGKIRSELRRPLSGEAALRKIHERRSDGSPRRRCSVCGDVFNDDGRCYCTRRRRPDEMPYGGWPSLTREQLRRSTPR
jgi:hypothetical protein